jgi:hypothetical protein
MANAHHSEEAAYRKVMMTCSLANVASELPRERVFMCYEYQGCNEKPEVNQFGFESGLFDLLFQLPEGIAANEITYLRTCLSNGRSGHKSPDRKSS